MNPVHFFGHLALQLMVRHRDPCRARAAVADTSMASLVSSPLGSLARTILQALGPQGFRPATRGSLPTSTEDACQVITEHLRDLLSRPKRLVVYSHEEIYGTHHDSSQRVLLIPCLRGMDCAT